MTFWFIMLFWGDFISPVQMWVDLTTIYPITTTFCSMWNLSEWLFQI